MAEHRPRTRAKATTRTEGTTAKRAARTKNTPPRVRHHVAEETTKRAPLVGLPPELITLIVEELECEDDVSSLKRLCLTSKLLRQIVTPLLYRLVIIKDTTPTTSLRLGRGLMNPSNPGLRFIRHLNIHRASKKSAAQILTRLLQILPRNGLESLGISTIDLDEATTTTILTQQQCLRNLALGGFTFDSTELFNSGFLGDSIWANIQCLIIPDRIGSRADLKSYNTIIQQAPKLKELTVRTSSIDNADSKTLWNRRGGDGVLFSDLLSHVQDTDVDSMLRLDSLMFVHTNLYAPERCLSKKIDFASLRELQLDECPHSDALLVELGKIAKTRGCAMQTFRIAADYVCGEALDEFLSAFEGLRQLQIQIDDTANAVKFANFDTGCLTGHQSTLEEFVFAVPCLCACEDYGSCEQYILPVLRFAKSCKKLTALAVPFPMLHMDRNRAGKKKMQRYDSSFIAAVSLPELEILRILNFPTATQHTFDTQDVNKSNETKFNNMLDHFVTGLFQRVNPEIVRKLPEIWYGGYATSHACDGHSHVKDRRAAYAMETRTAFMGGREVCAVRVPRGGSKREWPGLDMIVP